MPLRLLSWRARPFVILLLAGFVLAWTGRAAAPYRAPKRPALIVLLVIDQFRGDYVDRYGHQWTGGLKRLVTESAYFSRTNYPYFNTVTCSGHATISTGSYPSVHGMILNAWWDRARAREVACSDDDTWSVLSYGANLTGEGESAHFLRTTTLADEMRAQLATPPRVLGFSLKARTAVTLVGQRADAVTWFDDRGAWVTSTGYASAPVPAVAAYVATHSVEADFGRAWDRQLPADQYLFESPAVGATPKSAMTPAFPHVIRGPGEEPDATFYAQWQSSPLSDAYLADLALATVRGTGAGQTSGTDFLAIGFSALDKIGHDFGPRSHEVQDILINVDRTLARVFSTLDDIVGKDRYVVAVSADHGVAPIPEQVRVLGIDSGRVSVTALEAAMEDALQVLGPGKHVAHIMNTDVYFTRGTWAALRKQPALLARMTSRLLARPGVRAVYNRDDLEANHFDDDPIGRSAARGHDPERSGDLTIVLKPYWMLNATGTTHGSAYGYDTHVPLFLMGAPFIAGEHRDQASPADIAPTLAYLAGVTLPRAQGRVLTEALVR